MLLCVKAANKKKANGIIVIHVYKDTACQLMSKVLIFAGARCSPTRNG